MAFALGSSAPSPPKDSFSTFDNGLVELLRGAALFLAFLAAFGGVLESTDPSSGSCSPPDPSPSLSGVALFLEAVVFAAALGFKVV